MWVPACAHLYSPRCVYPLHREVADTYIESRSTNERDVDGRINGRESRRDRTPLKITDSGSWTKLAEVGSFRAWLTARSCIQASVNSTDTWCALLGNSRSAHFRKGTTCPSMFASQSLRFTRQFIFPCIPNHSVSTRTSGRLLTRQKSIDLRYWRLALLEVDYLFDIFKLDRSVHRCFIFDWWKARIRLSKDKLWGFTFALRSAIFKEKAVYRDN